MAIPDASRGDAGRLDRVEFLKEAFAAFAALGFIAWALYVAVAAVWLTASNCDESCFRPDEAPDWTYYVNSWQWHAIRILGFAQLGLAAIAVALAYTKAKRIALLALALHLLALLTLVAIRATGDGWEFSSRVVVPFFLAEAAGILAVVTLARKPSRLLS